MANFRGLNIERFLNDIDDKDEALINLGLNRGDLDVIQGLSEALGSQQFDEFRLMSGLDVDQKKELYALSRSGASLESILTGLEDIQQPLRFDMSINAPLKAGAIKYNYLDFSNPTGPLKGADISTSRVSSWSSVDSPVTLTSPIFYGGDLQVLGNNIELDELEILEEPTEVEFAAEEATDIVTININGTPQEFFTMKGIPLVYETFFRNANLAVSVDSGATTPTFRITNQDDLRQYAGFTSTSYPFRDVRSRPRTVEIFANPRKVLSLSLSSINLIELPQVQLPILTKYTLENNDFYQMPNFTSLAPSLEELYIKGNNMSRAKDANGNQIVANTQLDTIGSSSSPLRVLNISGCFSDSTDIDISKYQSLQSFTQDAYWARYSARGMVNSGRQVTPEVNASSIVNYTVRHMGAYDKLANSIMTAGNLDNLNIDWCNITAGDNGSGGDVDITLASNGLLSFSSHSNSHNVVDVSNKSDLTSYSHRYSRGLRGQGTASSSLIGKFSGCGSLRSINFYATDVEGSVQSAFSGLGSLSFIDIRWTRTSGGFDDNSFDDSPSLANLYMAGSYHNATMFPPSPVDSGPSRVFHNTPGLRRLYMYSNRNFKGNLPDFSKCPSLNLLYINGTGFTGSLPNFSNNNSLWGLYMWSNAFTGPPPALNGSGFYYVYLNSNQLSGQIPTLVGASNIRRWYLHNNNLSGNVPLLDGLPRLQYFLLQNNNLTDYTPGAISTNTWLRRLDIANNDLSPSAGKQIILDALANYNANKRGGVTINLLGNSRATEAVLIDNNETVADALDFLRNSGWTILLE